MFGLSKAELAVFKKLTTPVKIQDFLDSFPRNMEKQGDTCMSPRRVLLEKKMHCYEGAMVAALALWLNGEEPWLCDLRADNTDYDHVVALYRRNGYWGAISKTNYATLRFRDPVYKNLRELGLSYFHEYFVNETGHKSLVECSLRPFNLKTMGTDWITSPDHLYDIAVALDDAPHQRLLPPENRRFIRRADKMEIKAGKLIEWKKTDPRT